MIRRLRMSMAFLALFTLFPDNAIAGFITGNIYSPLDNGIVLVRNPMLNKSGQFHVPDVTGATGAVFGQNGDLVLIDQRFGTTRVTEVDSTGKLVREYNTGDRTLLRGSYIAYDPSRHVYAFANDNRITLLNGSLNVIGQSTNQLVRASGVTIAPNGRIYATDQFSPAVYQYSANLVLLHTFSYSGFVPTGIDAAADGSILVTAFGAGEIDRLHPTTGVITPVVTGLGYGGVSDVFEYANGRILTTDGHATLMLFSPGGKLLAESSSDSQFGDGFAIVAPVPEPASLYLAGPAMLFLLMRARKRLMGKASP